MQLKKNSDRKLNVSDCDDKTESMEVEEFAANEKDEGTEHNEEARDMENTMKEISQHMGTNMTIAGHGSDANSDGNPNESKVKSNLQVSVAPEVCQGISRWWLT